MTPNTIRLKIIPVILRLTESSNGNMGDGSVGQSGQHEIYLEGSTPRPRPILG